MSSETSASVHSSADFFYEKVYSKQAIGMIQALKLVNEGA